MRPEDAWRPVLIFDWPRLLTLPLPEPELSLVERPDWWPQPESKRQPVSADTLAERVEAVVSRSDDYCGSDCQRYCGSDARLVRDVARLEAENAALKAVVEAARVIRGNWQFDPEDEDAAAFDVALAALDWLSKSGGETSG